VFGTLIGGGVKNFTAYVLVALLPYTFFQQSVLDSAQSVLGQLSVVKKVYFPREILPLSSILANFVNLLIGMGIFFVLLLIVYLRDPRVVPFQPTTVVLPYLLICSLLMATGIGLAVCALNTFYEDVKYIVSNLMYLLFFLSPITYLSEKVAYSDINQRSGGLVFQLYHLNPVAALSTAYRQCLLAPQGVMEDGVLQPPIPLDAKYYIYIGVFAVTVCIGGYALFNRLKWQFVERP